MEFGSPTRTRLDPSLVILSFSEVELFSACDALMDAAVKHNVDGLLAEPVAEHPLHQNVKAPVSPQAMAEVLRDTCEISDLIAPAIEAVSKVQQRLVELGLARGQAQHWETVKSVALITE